MNTATSITESFRNGLTRLFDYIPQLIGALIVLLIGFAVAKFLQTTVRRLLRRLRFDHALHTSPAGKYIVRFVESPSKLLGGITFWVVFLVFVSFAVSALNLQVLNYILNGIYAYIPRVVSAIIIFLVASAVAAGADAFILRVLGNSPLAKIITTIIPAITLSIATFMILDELQVAATIVAITYGALMGAIALGLALAFGLGGRDLAHTMLEEAYTASQKNAESVKTQLKQAQTNSKQVVQEAKEKLS
jgi:uncharacterized protein YacL